MLLIVLAGAALLLASAGVAHAAPRAPVDAACAQKAPGSVAWCMPWVVRVETPPAGSASHWVTQCSKATSDEERTSCAAASVTLDSPPADGTASVLMDGPSGKDGLAALVRCGLFGEQMRNETDATRFGMWRDKHTQCSQQVEAWTAAAYDPSPQEKECGTLEVDCQITEGTKDAVAGGIRTGIQGLVDAIVQAEVYLLSRLAELVFAETSIASPDQAFYGVYNSVAGTLVMLIFVFFIIATIVNGLRLRGGPTPLATLGGLVKAVLGITFAGGLAYVIVTAWDQAAVAALEANADKPWDASKLVTALTNLNTGAETLLLAGLFGVLGIVGLILLFIIMLFRGVLTTGAALLGAMAMTGFVMDETKHWPRRWFWTVNALGSSKYWIVQLWIYGGRSTYESDDLSTVLQSMLLIWLMVLAPFILLKLTSMWDGYLSDVNVHGMLSALGGPLMNGANVIDGLREGAQSVAGGGGDDAAGVMNANASSMPTNPVGQMAGIGAGPGRDVAQAASRGEDGGAVGSPITDAPGSQGEQAGADGRQSPNAQEADGIRAANSSAQHTLSSGQLTAPGDSSGGSLPLTPQSAAGADPTGVTHGDTSSAASADQATTAISGDTSADSGGGHTDGQPSGAAAGGDPAGTAPNAHGGDTSAPSADEQASGSGGSGGGAAKAGGASAVADAPIVPL
ncbi:hypothetical protein [Actinoplanes flavus]|uniref:TrbL/VirB6 plasmid conjugal transfer protein n=1 Tax=Actinoplanes flavus TaxID=2820290 RepID=A0ABS3UCW8_9ACTN|nr:hypothetical protein [Actinoplanes flavus]MBO3736620.1 hypothetical protein [Actinoplanes flavus]